MDSSTTEKEDSNLTFPKEDRSGCDNNDVQDTDRHGNIDLNDSEYTADSLINEPGSGMRWFGGIGTEFLNCLTDNVSPVVSGVATLVHKTAVAVANEISQLERDGELEAESTLPERFHRDCGDDRDDDNVVRVSKEPESPASKRAASTMPCGVPDGKVEDGDGDDDDNGVAVSIGRL